MQFYTRHEASIFISEESVSVCVVCVNYSVVTPELSLLYGCVVRSTRVTLVFTKCPRSFIGEICMHRCFNFYGGLKRAQSASVPFCLKYRYIMSHWTCTEDSRELQILIGSSIPVNK